MKESRGKRLKVVYYGCGVSGCTTNMIELSSQIKHTADGLSDLKPYYSLTTVFLKQLRDYGISTAILEAVHELLNQEFDSPEDFLKVMQQNLYFQQREFEEMMKAVKWEYEGIRVTFESIDILNIGPTQTFPTVGLYKPFFSTVHDPRRKELLYESDGIVFVADSQKARLKANISAIEELENNLLYHGRKLASVPLVIQYNKRDLPNIHSIEELEGYINRYHAPYIEAIAVKGIGVPETFTTLIHLIEKTGNI